MPTATDSDKVILDEYLYATYASAPEVYKRSLEPALLTEIVRSSNNELDENYLSWDNCSDLLRCDPQFRALLLDCWEDGCFQSVRKSGEWAFAIGRIICFSSYPTRYS
jgi:hypothetical protein